MRGSERVQGDTRAQIYDVAVVGGGLVGLSTAYELTRCYPDSRVLVIEKENEWAAHQSGHNSGVIHSGIYYKPGSMKAHLSRQGGEDLRSFCEEHGVEHEFCGKVLIATEEEELDRLEALYKRGIENRLDVSLIGAEELKEIEPHAFGTMIGFGWVVLTGSWIEDGGAIGAMVAFLIGGKPYHKGKDREWVFA